ncbi:ATP synthase F0 subunit B [Kitasatospora sp. NPDC093679]|uniref:ATP synthase F0 subunit B n=1 Tax=Kitasatospora sp. NPDC093679 TaxID=3154983 RepID=UPI003447F151
MDVQQQLDEIVASVENARAMPMSASCVVNRADLVGMLRDLKAALPAELAQAQSVVADHQQMVADAHSQAEEIIRGAHDERGSLISDTEVVMRARAEADRILAEARAEVEAKRAEADDYVDSKLANFEVVLTKTLGAVGRGRQKLRGAGVYEPEDGTGEDGEEFQPRVSPSPEADEYVDAKLATLEAVLGATLEAVGKGRDKLLGKQPIDELGAYLAAADEAQQQKDRAEAVAAGFATEGEEQPWYREEVPQQQAWPDQTPAAAGWQNPGEDAYGNQGAPQYADVYGGGYDPSAGGQTDPYGNQYGYQQPAAAYQGQEGVADGYYQQQGYQADPYGNQYGYQQQPQAQLPHQQQAGLDETSFFDTSMIDMTRLRELGGR